MCISEVQAYRKLLHFTDVEVLHIKGKSLRQQKYYDSLYCGLQSNPQYLRDTPGQNVCK